MSLRELVGLAPGAWGYAGLADDGSPLLAQPGRQRRRPAQKPTTGEYKHDEAIPSPPRSPVSPQSATGPTPPSVPSSRTSFSTDQDRSESEMSSPPEDASDYSDNEGRARKKRKVKTESDAPAKRVRKPSKKVLANRAVESDVKARGRSETILKVGRKKLQEFEKKTNDAGNREPAPPTTPVREPLEANDEQAPLTPPPTNRRDAGQQPQEAPTAKFWAAEDVIYGPFDSTSDTSAVTPLPQSDPGSLDFTSDGSAATPLPQSDSGSIDSTSDASTATLLPQSAPPKQKRKRGRPKKAERPSPKRRSAAARTEETESQDHTTPKQALVHVPDPIPAELDHLVEISKQLMQVSGCPIEAKPLPVGSPEVWADGRQALCESLPYYRAYQSAGYCTGGFAVSFMFDQEGSPRDYIDSEVVIARSGGGLSKDKTTGKMARQADQTEGSQVRSVRNSMAQYHPVAILSGNRNLQCPSKMPRIYNVLDWFKPTHIWFEKVDGKANIRYRFEKLCKDTQSWWASSAGPEPTRVGEQAPPHTQTCSQCQQNSQQVYLQGWMCLQPDCPQFWKLESGNEPHEAGLLYDPRFLKQHTPWPHSSAPQPLRPNFLALGPTPILGEDVAWVAAKGLVCPQCGRCNSREAWEGWTCSNCSFTHNLPHANVPASALHDVYNPLSAGYALSRDWAAVPMRVEFAHNYRINYFALPGLPECFVAHFIANKTVNEESGGPDSMWEELQTVPDLGLRRRPLQNSTLQGPLLTQHFCVNYGMPYKFIAATSSRSFDGAASAITTTRSRLNWAARYCREAAKRSANGEEAAQQQKQQQQDEQEKDFNELLALGYFERQKIEYHDDGEYGLGPTIATLSLGAPAHMRLRLKHKHHNGVTRGIGAYVDASSPPVPGCVKYEERRAAYAELQELRKDASDEEYREKIKELPRELGLLQGKRGNANDAVNLHLGHGDIVVMHGAKIQEYYEHAVDPVGKLRFALTCRYIDPDSVKLEDRPEYEVLPDAGEYDGSRLPAVSA